MSKDHAFPQHGWSSDPVTIERMQACAGLTKRELFAAMAMQGFCSSYNTSAKEASAIAFWSLEVADALLRKLEEAK